MCRNYPGAWLGIITLSVCLPATILTDSIKVYIHTHQANDISKPTHTDQIRYDRSNANSFYHNQSIHYKMWPPRYSEKVKNLTRKQDIKLYQHHKSIHPETRQQVH
ncbi:hypothetical protein B0T17DRAFT_513994 [Bombardia bombarda]|uniref:Secreted protein n=1 Tax=Bombardia bombarda TaxID=252184 RepID=A0AA39XIR9_9PEZI|nr:hypothetical protein B0T17DRAFT_513994 [Bombardia bombarda]